MNIAISGAGGFIGKQLTFYFQSKGHEVRSISRFNTDTAAGEIVKELSGVDVIINLAGAPIIGRWTRRYKKALLGSRVNTTRKIVEAISLMDIKPQLLISASAVGIYSQEGEQTESMFKLSDDYLGKICQAWEMEAKKAAPFTRVVITRLGIVLGKEGGMLRRLLPLFRLGLGGKIASGKQGFSWIHVYDVIQAFDFIIENPNVSGIFNFTAPNVVDNKRFTKLLARILGKSAVFHVPSFALRLLYGKGASAILGGQFALPKHLIDSGFQFCYPDLKSALEDITMN